MIDAYLTDTVSIIRSGGLDSYGEPLPTTTVTAAARIERRARLVRDQTGREILAPIRVLLRDQPTINSRIALDGGERGIVAIEERRDFTNTYYVAYLE